METEIFTVVEENAANDPSIQKAADVIKRGGLVVFPTETVYGLGADATNPDAAKKIYAAKDRPSDNPLIIHISSPEMAEDYAYTNELYYKLADAFMPGPLTVILKAKSTVPYETRGGLDTVAVRCPENKIANELIKKAGVPIAAPSANLSGSPSPTNSAHVIDDMLDRVDAIIDGGSSDFGLESTIVKAEEDKLILLRPGKITPEALSIITEEIVIADAVTEELKSGEKAISPGMKYRHYAPKAPVVLLDGGISEKIKYILSDLMENIAVFAYSDEIEKLKNSLPNAVIYDFGAREDLVLQAHNLFSLLREADKKNFTKIYAPLPHKEGLGLALYNRMIRAAAHKIIRL